MCGIVGISNEVECIDIQEELVRALTHLQHRGQDSAGIAIMESDGGINVHKDVGLVSQVFRNKIGVTGKSGIGHVRYSTQGTNNKEEAQPFYTNSPCGITLVHNGNLTNTEFLTNYLSEKRRYVQTGSDSEILMHILAVELAETPGDLMGAMSRVMILLQGSYSVIAMIDGVGLIAFRDPRGIRPLIVGTKGTKGTKGYMLASESVAFLGSPYKMERDVNAGECILIENGSNHLSSQIVVDFPVNTPCLFEYIYFARPDSIIDGISVYAARERMAIQLAFSISQMSSSVNLDIDVVIPVPETSKTYAIQLAEVLNIRYREAFVKNRYIARTFISPDQDRGEMVKMKLSTIDSEFRGKNVLIVDDSIVRGTTSRELVKLAREAGAKRIWFASAAPPVCFANRLGIDIPTDQELIAHNRSNDEIASLLGCDAVFYNDLDVVCYGLRELSSDSSVDGFETSCFSE